MTGRRNFLNIDQIQRPVLKTKINSYLPANPKKDSPLHRSVVDQLQYALPKDFIQTELDARGLKRETEIWIYPDYPNSFTAIVGIKEEVYIFFVKSGICQLVDIKPCKGIRENGALIY